LPEIIEALESRSFQTSGGRGGGTRVFHASGYADAGSLFDALGQTVSGVRLPGKGEAHPDFPGMVAKDFNIQKEAGHTDLWKVVWSYEVISTGFAAGPPQPVPEVLPNEVSYVEISAEIRAEFNPAYRSDPIIPELGDPELGVDIEGDSIDAAGVPTSLQRNIQEITVTETVVNPDLDVYRSFRFTRNIRKFFGSPAGTLLYRGASIRRTGLTVYQVSHSFVEDEFMHLQQEPLIEPPDMKPKPDPNNEGKALTVSFVQPFPRTTNFNLISRNF